MKEILTYLISNADNLLAVATAIVAAASAIAALTPTPKDNELAAKAYKVIDWLALNIGKAKEK
jgi:hypothetical protein